MSYILRLTTSVLAKPELAKQHVIEILAQPEFTTTKEEYRIQYIGDNVELINFSTLDFIKLLANLSELLLWLGLIVGIIFIYKKRAIIKPYYSKKLADNIFSVSISKTKIINKPLLANVSNRAWELWQTGHNCAAISLLYCGALSVLQKRDGLQLANDATENECIKLVKLNQPNNLSSYFIGLTHTWQNIAYAGRQPDDKIVKELCEEWQLYFG